VKLFISYRRQDSAAWTGRLFDVLTSRYGTESVFLDFANIAPGLDFRRHITDAVSNCDAFLVVVGPRWLEASYREDGRRRIDDPNDFVRIELSTALQLQKPMVPVLVGGATMPTAVMLPDELRSLASLQSIPLGDATWNQDIGRVTSLLDRKAPSRWTRWLPWKR
jgi:hypothetical protein